MQNFSVSTKLKTVEFNVKSMPAGSIGVVVDGSYNGHVVIKCYDGMVQSLSDTNVCFTAAAAVTVRSLLPGEEFVIRGT